MANTVTIDNYDIKIHERYVHDQEILKGLAILFDESKEIPKHSEIGGSENSIKSKWEELFETYNHRHPFASFAPPPRFNLMRKRLFSNTISSKFNWADAEEDEEKQEREESKQLEEYKKKILSKKSKLTPLSLFEKDRSSLLTLLDAIQTLNSYLRELNARKLQYQKG